MLIFAVHIILPRADDRNVSDIDDAVAVEVTAGQGNGIQRDIARAVDRDTGDGDGQMPALDDAQIVGTGGGDGEREILRCLTTAGAGRGAIPIHHDRAVLEKLDPCRRIGIVAGVAAGEDGARMDNDRDHTALRLSCGRDARIVRPGVGDDGIVVIGTCHCGVGHMC